AFLPRDPRGGGRERAADHRRRGYGLWRERDGPPDGDRVRPSRRGGPAHRGPGVPQAVRAPGWEEADPDGSLGGEGAGGGEGGEGARPLRARSVSDGSERAGLA